MHLLGETIALSVAFSWTITALCSEVASKRLGSLQLNVIRMVLSILMLATTIWIFTGSPYPSFMDGKAFFWLSLSGFVGYVLGDYCLFNAYILIGSRFGQLFMTLAPPSAAIAGLIVLNEQLTLQQYIGMLVTLSGIGISVLNKGNSTRKLQLKLPLKGILLGIGAGIGQGIGLVLSKIGMNYYALTIPEGAENVRELMPFTSTMVRALTGIIGFSLLMAFRREFKTLHTALHDKKGMWAALGATITGPFIGVSLSLMAVQYTEAGVASTLMALTPVIILWPAHVIFKQPVTTKEIIGAFISVLGVSLFFI